VSEDYKIQLSIKKGNDMVNVRADTAAELQAIVNEAKTKDDLKDFFVVPPKANAASVVGTGPVAPATSEAATAPGAQYAAGLLSKKTALENIAKHLGPGTEKAASAAQIAVAAKKSGKPAEELRGISEAMAKHIIATGKVT
jgi:hypothetical protein